uniref:B30.2/SPRY domain-containing protein n=1 Tax=Caenorhabditis tropicalis TaxID=1561998 RepID=A0A1I7USV0_9PELO
MQTVSPPVAPEEYDIDKVYLPRRWDMAQASSYLELSPNALTVSFKRNASIQGDKDPSGVVRSDKAIPSSIGTYYFEVRILHGHRGCMGVGLSRRGGELNRMPGWDPQCFGYHGDDGNFFSACGHGRPYGPKFGTGDVIGCGIDTFLNIVFFTKNGKHLSTAYQGQSGQLQDLHPTVGLKTPGERLHVNFGQAPFMFDFEGYRKILNNEKIHKMENIAMPDEIGTFMDRVVTSFLGHSGALETLKAFEKVSKQPKPIDHEFLRKRKEIVDMVMNATHGSLIQEKLEEHFPGCVAADHKVNLILMCLRYVDLANTLQKPPPSFRASNSDPPRSSSPTEIRSRPPKLLKGSHCKSTKRTREAQKKHGKSHTPPPVRRTSAKAAEDLVLNHSKIEQFFIDEDTGEEMVSIDGFSLTKKMYIELYNSEEYGKLTYMINMGREINTLAAKVGNQLNTKDRNILEASMTMVLSPGSAVKHPLYSGYRRYIANVMVEMINGYIPKSEEKKPSDAPPIKENRIYSELHGMFLAWQGAHKEASQMESPAAAIYFMKNMVLEDLTFDEKPVEMSNEPMEISSDEREPLPEEGNGVVMEEEEDEDSDEGDI